MGPAYLINEETINNNGELFIFKLNKTNMIDLLSKYGHYAHGTIHKLGNITLEQLNNPELNMEYSIRPKFKDKCWNELLLYRVDEI